MKKYKKTTKDMMITGIGLGVASSLAPNSGIGNVASAMPKVGTIVGGRMVLDALGNLQRSAKMKKKEY